MHGDKERMLRLDCQQRLEAEANYATGRLLFLRDAFAERLLSSAPVSFDRVKELTREFGNTMTSTLWRAVETIHSPTFGLVSQHPRHQLDPERAAVRYFLRSQTFREQFSSVTEAEVFCALGSC